MAKTSQVLKKLQENKEKFNQSTSLKTIESLKSSKKDLTQQLATKQKQIKLSIAIAGAFIVLLVVSNIVMYIVMSSWQVPGQMRYQTTQQGKYIVAKFSQAKTAKNKIYIKIGE